MNVITPNVSESNVQKLIIKNLPMKIIVRLIQESIIKNE